MSRYSRNASLKPVATKADAESNETLTVLDWGALKEKKAAGTVDEEFPFTFVCMIKGNAVIFAAQLDNGERMSVIPVMPKSELDGSVLAPANGEEGYLTITRSENCKLTRDKTGKIDMTIRPVFKDWESVADRAARLAKEPKKS